MAHTDRTTVLAMAIMNKIKSEQTSLGIGQVLYGNHTKIPDGKTVVVTSGQKTRQLAGVGGPGGRTLNSMRVFITVYFSLVEGEEVARLELDRMAEDIEHMLHQDTSINDLIIHGFINIWDPGIAFRSKSMFRVVQMEFVGQSKTQLTDIP
jgi:hypothetical protein